MLGPRAARPVRPTTRAAASRRSCAGARLRRRPPIPCTRAPQPASARIKKRGELRGCIGTLSPAEPSLGREIARNAYSAAFHDPRFPPVSDDELGALTLLGRRPERQRAVPARRARPAAVYGVIVVAGPAAGGVAARPRRCRHRRASGRASRCRRPASGPASHTRLERFTVTRYGEAGCDIACG